MHFFIWTGIEKLWGLDFNHLFVVYVGRWLSVVFYGDDFEFCIWLLLLTPLSCCLLLPEGSCKRIEERDKDTFILKTLFWSPRFFWGGNVFLNELKLSRFPEKVLKYILVILGELFSRFTVCSVGVSCAVCLAEMAASRRHGWRQAWYLVSTCSVWLATEGKGYFQ